MGWLCCCLLHRTTKCFQHEARKRGNSNVGCLWVGYQRRATTGIGTYADILQLQRAAFSFKKRNVSVKLKVKVFSLQLSLHFECYRTQRSRGERSMRRGECRYDICIILRSVCSLWTVEERDVRVNSTGRFTCDTTAR